MRNLFVVAMLVLASAVPAMDEGDAFIAAGMRMVIEGKKDMAKDMLIRGIALSKDTNPKAYLELAKLSEADKDVAVSLYFSAYRLMAQDPKAANDRKLILAKLQVLSKPTAELILAMQGYAAELDSIAKVRKDELTQEGIQERRESLQLEKYAQNLGPAGSNSSRMDLLKALDVSTAIKGTWKREGTDVVVEPAAYGRIGFPCTVSAEYDVFFSFTCQQSKNGVTLVVQWNGKPVAFEIGSYGRLTGFTLIDGRGLDANPTATEVPGGFQLNKRYNIVVQVRKNKLAALIDGKVVVETSLPQERFQLDERWSVTSKCPIGIGNYSNVVRFHAVEVVAR